MRTSRFTKWVVILSCIVLAMLLAWNPAQGNLGASPLNFAIRTTGILSLIFLVLSLTVTPRTSRLTKWVVILSCIVPAMLLAWNAAQGNLGASPVTFAIRTTGDLSLIFLVLSLTVTPLTRLSGWSSLGQFRRVFGLYAFFHASIHFGLFFLFDRSADVAHKLSEIGTQPYLLVGTVGLLIMLPLAITSTNGMVRRLGPKRWKMLHRSAYIAAAAGALHYYMLVKGDPTLPLLFAAILSALFGYRLIAHSFHRSDAYKYRTAATMPARGVPKPGQWSGSLQLAKIFRETPEVRTFRLVTPSGSKLPFDYLPGQYLILRPEIDGQKVRRCYTIASSPTRNEYCEVTIKREEQGLVSRYMHDMLREGAVLNITAPAGRFTFTGVEAERIVMIAGGVGITPLMAKIRYLIDLAWPGTIELIFSVKTEQDIIFREELESLQKRFANFKLKVTLTRDISPTWRGERGRITPVLLTRAVADLSRSRVHLCAPTEMTDGIITMLRDLGVPAEQIKVESFSSPGRAKTGGSSANSDRQKGGVDAAVEETAATLRFARSEKLVTGLGRKTILEIAEEQGVSLPYECRSGICGQCKTKLVEGTVTMDVEDALDSVDRANSLILTCQARCRDDVVIDA
jgi:ferredoxin-NADP reductase/DMSO/TMAO reductase YedYZ heme-binding membrane subunit